MKVRNCLLSSRPSASAVLAVALAWAVSAGAVVPLAASAEALPAPPATTAGPPVTAVATTATAKLVAKVTPPRKKLTVPQRVAQVGHAKGLSKTQVSALLWIAKRESNFHPTSKSSSGCYGLFQLSRGMTSGHPWKDPTWNTKRAIKYMKGRYGGVVQAKSFWSQHHWY